MSYRGTIRGNVVELDEPAPFPAGSRVEVTMALEAEVRRGSPKAVLRLAGTLTHEEAELIRKTATEIRRVDPSLWKDPRR